MRDLRKAAADTLEALERFHQDGYNREDCGVQINALRAALAQDGVCGECGGTGELDSGGTYPWGEPAMIRCPCTERPAALAQEAEPVVPSCPTCGTHEVSFERICHNSKCADYGQQHTTYEGWSKPAPAAPSCPYIRSSGPTHWCSLNGPPAAVPAVTDLVSAMRAILAVSSQHDTPTFNAISDAARIALAAALAKGER